MVDQLEAAMAMTMAMSYGTSNRGSSHPTSVRKFKSGSSSRRAKVKAARKANKNRRKKK